MACRKNAYRAMTEFSEWMQEQQEHAQKKMLAMKEKQGKIWTPPQILQQCCLPWLVDGPEVVQTHNNNHGGAASSLYNNRGCSGGCGKDHPRITLDFDIKEQRSVAILSHELDPFIEYFESLCQQGLASSRRCQSPSTTKIGSTTHHHRSYYWNGFLQSHLETLKQQKRSKSTATTKFGFHLIKVSSSKALSDSRRAHERYLEQQEVEHQRKRRKLQGQAADNHLLSSVLDICCQHSLLDHLDLAEISWMRVTCKTMAKVAAKMSRLRMKRIRLEYSVWKRLNRDNNNSNMDIETFYLANNKRKYGLISPRRRLILPLGKTTGTTSTTSNTRNTFLVPQPKNVNEDILNRHRCTTEWKYYHPDKNDQNEEEEEYLVQLYLLNNNDGDKDNNNSSDFNPWLRSEQQCLFSDKKSPYASLQIARCHITLRTGLPVGTFTSSSSKVTYTLTSPQGDDDYTTTATTTESTSDGISHDTTSLNSTNSMAATTTTATTTTTMTITTAMVKSVQQEQQQHNPGNTNNNQLYEKNKKLFLLFSVQSIRFDFADLLGIYVRKKLPLAKQQLQEMKAKRPVTSKEKDYVRALAKAAREAPRINLEGMMDGW